MWNRRGKRRGGDSNPRNGYPFTRFPVAFLQPLGHLSGKDGASLCRIGLVGLFGMRSFWLGRDLDNSTRIGPFLAGPRERAVGLGPAKSEPLSCERNSALRTIPGLAKIAERVPATQTNKAVMLGKQLNRPSTTKRLCRYGEHERSNNEPDGYKRRDRCHSSDLPKQPERSNGRPHEKNEQHATEDPQHDAHAGILGRVPLPFAPKHLCRT